MMEQEKVQAGAAATPKGSLLVYGGGTCCRALARERGRAKLAGRALVRCPPAHARRRISRLACCDGSWRGRQDCRESESSNHYTHRIARRPPHTSPKMAAISAAPSRSFLAAFLPIARASLFPQHTTGSIVNRIPTFSHLRTALVPAAFLPIPGIIDALWEGILKAVPKKKTSHM